MASRSPLSSTRTFTIDPGPLSSAVDRAHARLDQLGFVDALWRKRLDVWSDNAPIQKLIEGRLGWLNALDVVVPQLPRLRAFAEAVRRDGFTHVVLLGMGGSSLAPEVLRQILSSRESVPAFRVLDSVDPDAVRGAMDHADTSLFIMASKSGSTIEPNTMAAEARRRVIAAGHTNWATRFAAITDENTTLHKRAVADGYREIFVNPSDIGGRYSALSLFGMVPAALLGIDLDAMTAGARAMEAACRLAGTRDNPGLALGAVMAAGAANKRDKLTLLLPTRLESFGLWVEQLVAESTGKHDTGVVPIAGESARMSLGSDRVIVTVNVGGETPDAAIVERAKASGAPIVTIELPDVDALGAEFLRWEVATATAGLLIEINPFDEPNVKQAKDATTDLLTVYQQRGQLPVPEPHAEVDDVRLTLSEAAQTHLSGQDASSFLSVIGRHDYFCLLAFLPPDGSGFDAALQEFRMNVAARAECATMFGYGPRYLHSTGQLHKGGANNGVFLIVVADAAEDLAIPDQPFSFSVLETAQALGDFQSLDRCGRRAMLMTLPKRDPELFRRIAAMMVS
jgi:glucose-6-phosphate isomerase/transaldolase/glucose-6-phosphate isomerase